MQYFRRIVGFAKTVRVGTLFETRLASSTDGLRDAPIWLGDNIVGGANVAGLGPCPVILIVGTDVSWTGLECTTFLGIRVSDFSGLRTNAACAGKGWEETSLHFALSSASWADGCLADMASGIALTAASIGIVAETTPAIDAHQRKTWFILAPGTFRACCTRIGGAAAVGQFVESIVARRLIAGKDFFVEEGLFRNEWKCLGLLLTNVFSFPIQFLLVVGRLSIN